MSRTQPARFGEAWDDERIAGWMNIPVPTDEDPDFFRLWRAYQSMRAYDFERFVQIFLERGGRMDARNKQGETLYTILRRHPMATDFLHVLEDAGCPL